jgi:hypothetical protein
VRRRREGLRDLLAFAVVIGVVAGLGVLLMRANPTFSRIDELEHFNYVTVLADQHRIPRPGDHYTQAAMHAQACNGYQLGGTFLQPCHAAHYDPAAYPGGGVTSAGGYPPVYYLATTAVAVALRAVLGSDSLFVPARLASLLWLALGAVTVFLLARRVGAGRAVATGVGVLAACAPMMLEQGTTVNPDAMSLLAGAGTALVWLSVRRTTSWRGLVGAAAALSAVALVKANLLALPAAVLLAELVLAARPGPRILLRRSTWSWRAPLGRVLIAVAVSEFVGLAWSYLFMIAGRPAGVGPAAVATGAPPHTNPWNLNLFLHYAPGSFVPLNSGAYVHVFDHGALDLLTAVLDLLVVSGAVVAVLLAGPRLAPAPGDGVHPGRAVGYLAASCFVLAAPVVFVLTSLSGSFVAYPPRYSLFIVPLGLVALVAVSGRRRSLLFAVLAVVVVLVELRFLVR